ncbi:hypothetical protein DKX38_015493 [Salix brachista]|uniref:Fe2OG dioxygenase domain-containing protein n=1 Tax=Salix brachista TaxID=2182728 RepID=A0A5N5L5R1_9ROSI|nr:hypothetical protein DKX38_015493 [Salix brachista]
MIDSSPPLLHHFGELARLSPQIPAPECNDLPSGTVVMKECCQLPLIDLGCLNSTTEREPLACAEAICRASSEWGFFQVVNHGISPELVRNMRREQVKLFQTPFDKKATCGVLNNSYRWGTPTATCPKQFSWSEAFHIPLSKVSEQACYGEFSSLREVMVEFSAAMSKLARVLAGVLAGNLGHPRGVFENICQENNCFLRLNRYPACPVSPEISGLVPHTDSDFLTILSQDEVGGLQLMKDSKWVAVNPNQDALIVNIGDLFQTIYPVTSLHSPHSVRQHEFWWLVEDWFASVRQSGLESHIRPMIVLVLVKYHLNDVWLAFWNPTEAGAKEAILPFVYTVITLVGPKMEKFVEIPFLEPEMFTSPDSKPRHRIIRSTICPLLLGSRERISNPISVF